MALSTRPRSLQIVFSLLVFAGAASAQNSYEMFANSYAGPPPNGPLASQTVQLLIDPAPGSPPVTVINVTATLSNQQYTGVGTGAGNPVVVFGGRRADGTTTINTTPIFDEMNSIAAPVDSQFSSQLSGTPTGISVSDNFAFALYSSIQHWEGLSVPATNSRVYIADLTLTFSAPVTNPDIQLVGMGGFVGSLGYASELTLVTPGLTLSKVQGNSTLVVSGSEINNANAAGISTNCNNNTAGCGTVRVIGSNISTITFQVYIRGDGGTPTWSVPARNEGDFWMLGVSVPSASTAGDVSLGGRVTNANGRALKNINLLLSTATGQVKTAVTNAFGYYRFDGLEAGQPVSLRVSSKRHRFPNPVQLITPGDNALDVNFVAEN